MNRVGHVTTQDRASQRRLIKHPRACLLHKSKPISCGGRCGRFRAHGTGLRHELLTGFHQVNFHHGIHSQGRAARTEKAAETYVFRVGFFLKILSMGIDSGDLYVHAEWDAHFGSRNGVLFLQPRQAAPQSLEVDGLFEKARRP
jgi:hypothetical protein